MSTGDFPQMLSSSYSMTTTVPEMWGGLKQPEHRKDDELFRRMHMYGEAAVTPAPQADEWRQVADARLVMIKEAATLIVELEAEVERLRMAVGLLTTLHGTMEIDASDPVGMAQTVVKHVNDQLRKEREEIATVAGAARIPLDTPPADHRLGLPQPDGEPCTPMSARAWRWLP